MSDEAHPHEIVIIKRRTAASDEAHHGGAWKIAYADFVTAMMAFFLVMWLLSANEKTKASIVKYFNPVQLVDSTPQPPGLSDPSLPDPKKAVGKPPPDGKDPTSETKDRPAPKELGRTIEQKVKEDAKEDAKSKEEAALFKDPYAVLAEIATKDNQPVKLTTGPGEGGKAPTDGIKGGSGTAGGAAGARGGEAFRDPFEPLPPPPASSQETAAMDAAHADALPPPPTLASTASAATTPPSDPVMAPLPAEPAARAAELKKRIESLLKAVAAASPGPEPKVEVKATSEGVLISLADDAKFSMFANASTQPSPRAVTLMEKIGKLIKAQKGRIVIRGYTDSRKYKSGTYDNWRLSSDRANVAHYMLTRGGLDDARVERVEGYADRQLRNAKDPDSPENRRIEILLREAP